MIGHIERVMLASLVAAIGVLLVIVAFFQNTSDENAVKIYSISVIVSNPGERFIKGVEQAALDYNADVHLVSGYAKNDSARQIEYMQRELANNVDAVVIFPENAGDMEEYLGALHQRARVVTVGQRLPSNRLAAHVGVDDVQLGETLGEMVVRKKAGGECAILCPKDARPYHNARIGGIENVLEAHGMSSSVLYCDEDNLSETLAGLGDAAIAVLDEGLLVAVCEQARPEDLIFGAGFAGGARAYLENNTIQGIVAYSEYDAGYLSLREAVMQVDNKPVADVETGLYEADSRTMYSPPLVYILFPIG